MAIYGNGMILGFIITVGFPTQENLPLHYSDLPFTGIGKFLACQHLDLFFRNSKYLFALAIIPLTGYCLFITQLLFLYVFLISNPFHSHYVVTGYLVGFFF